MGEYPPGHHPNSRANLDLSRGRKPAAGRTIREWLNVMIEWTKAEVASVLEGDEEPMSKRIAAQTILAASEDDWFGAAHKGTGVAVRLIEQTDGKATQKVESTVKVQRPPDEVYAELRRILTDDPELLGQMLTMIPPEFRRQLEVIPAESVQKAQKEENDEDDAESPTD